MYLDARKASNVLLPSQAQLADRAEILVTALAKTGITGLIDEATGYQQFRARDALQAYMKITVLKNKPQGFLVLGVRQSDPPPLVFAN